MLAEATLPPPAADALRTELPRLADDIIAAIAAEVPGYARPMEGRFGQVVRFGVEVALNRFVDLLAAEAADEASTRGPHVGPRAPPAGPLRAPRRRGVPGRALPRRAAGRLPRGRPPGLAAVRGGRHAR